MDVQAAFAIPPALVAAIEKYSQQFQRRVFTKFTNPKGSLFRTQLGMDSCAPGSPDTRLLIPPSEGDLVFAKAGYGLSPFQLQKLRSAGIRQVEVCGVDTDACVMGVMFSLFDAKISCSVVEKLCWSAQDLHREAVQILQTQFPRRRRRS